MSRQIPEDLNPYTRKKFEAIHTYDPFESAITALNKEFHNCYNLLIQDTHTYLGQKNSPVIVKAGDRLTLLHDGERETCEIIPHLYHLIKSISHISFGIYITLVSNGYAPLENKIRLDLEY